MINILALVWTVFICAMMVMPPNQRSGFGVAAVVGALYLFHRLTGRHEMRKRVWKLGQESSES